MSSATPTNTIPAVHLQLIPYSENAKVKPTLKELIDRKVREGEAIRIGRQVIKEGQPQGRAANSLLLETDVWFTSKVVSRNHAEFWTRQGQMYVKDIGSSSGTFLNKMRLSPSGKVSRPYPVKEGDILQFGIDYKGKQEDIYKSIIVEIRLYDNDWSKQHRRDGNTVKFKQALKSMLAATNPYGSSKEDTSDDGSTDCCICIGPIGPYQALFIAPCSHCYHYKCVSSIILQTPMFQCPLCRQVANLAASVSMESLHDSIDQLDHDEEAGKTPNNASADERMSDIGSDDSLSFSRPSSPLQLGITEATPMDTEPPSAIGARNTAGNARDGNTRSRRGSIDQYFADGNKWAKWASGTATPERDSSSANTPGKRRNSLTSKFTTFMGRKTQAQGNGTGAGDLILPENSPNGTPRPMGAHADRKDFTVASGSTRGSTEIINF